MVSGRAEPDHQITFSFDTQRIVMRVDQSEAPLRVVWTCLRHARFPEWEGTSVKFDLEAAGDDSSSTALTFEHAGLNPELECFPVCSAGWSHYLPAWLPTRRAREGMPWSSPMWRPATA